MGGSFGGYGNYVKAGEARSTYEIDASVDGKPATSIKLIAYLPGCEIVTLDIPVLTARQTPTPVQTCWPHFVARADLPGLDHTRTAVGSRSLLFLLIGITAFTASQTEWLRESAL